MGNGFVSRTDTDRIRAMQEEEWAECAVFIWLSAYVIFFIGACVLLRKRPSMPRWLMFLGTLMLLLVNLALLAQFLDVTDMQYNPMYEDSSWGFDPPYPEWQRFYWWGCSAMDFLGKILAGTGMITEGRRLMTAFRFQEMQKYQPQVNQPTPPHTPQAL